MPNFIVTFRLHSGSDYDARYQSVTTKIEEIAGRETWDETSSFYAFRSSSTARDICDRVYFESSIDSSEDVLVVFDTTNRKVAYRGAKYPATLESLIGAT